MADSYHQSPARTWPGRVALALVLVFSGALGAVAVFEFRSSPFFQKPIVDEQAYLQWADEIVAGGASDRPFYQDPLYPYFLAAVFELAGRSLLLVRLLQVVMGVAAVYLVYWTGRRLSGESAGLLSAALFALWGPLYFWELMVLKATLIILLSAAACALGVYAGENPSGRVRWAVLGAALGLLCLLRGNFLLIAPVVLVWAYVAGRALAPALLLAGMAVAIVPATVHNYLVSGEIVLTTSQGGPNFYIGNNDFADGTYVELPFVYASPVFEQKDFKAEAERRTGRTMTSGEVSRFWFREGLKWVRANPGRAAALTLRKAWVLAHRHEVSDNENYYFTREYFSRALYVPFLSFGVLWGPALVGAVVSARRRSAWFPIVFTCSYALSLLPFFVVARYRVPLAPALCVFAAAFLIWAGDALRKKNFRQLAAAAAVVLPALAVSYWPAPFAVNKDAISAFNLGNALIKDHPDRAMEWYRRAFTLSPKEDLYREAWEAAVARLGPDQRSLLLSEAARPDGAAAERYAVGQRFEELKLYVDAVSAYKGALALEPEYFPAHARLALVLASGPDPDPAQAERHLARALELSPNYVSRPDCLATIMALGAYYEDHGDTAAARRWYGKVHDRFPDYPDANEALERLAPE